MYGATLISPKGNMTLFDGMDDVGLKNDTLVFIVLDDKFCWNTVNESVCGSPNRAVKVDGVR